MHHITSLHEKPHTYGAFGFSCNQLPALSAEVSKLVFYAQSTGTVISGRQTAETAVTLAWLAITHKAQKMNSIKVE